MQESIMRAGSPIPMNGVVSHPQQVDSSLPAVVILNSGLMHHVGTCRMSVKIARALAKRGVWSVRFDCPGIGDSLMNRERTTHLESSPGEITLVIDELKKISGIQRFVVLGLCSGADAGFCTAIENSNIVGIAQIDPYLFRTYKWYLYRYSRLLLDVNTYKKLFKRLFNKLLARENTTFAENFFEIAEIGRELMEKDVVIAGYQKMVSRQQAVLAIITGGQASLFNHKTQFYDIFSDVDWKDLLDLQYFPEAEHILPEPEYQEKVKNCVINWVAKLQEN